MGKKTLFIVIGCGVIVAAVLLIYSLVPSKTQSSKEKNRKVAKETENEQGLAQARAWSEKMAPQEYPDAPPPESWVKSKQLWPDIGEDVPTAEKREKVKERWRKFAAKHPDNLYIPPGIQPEKSPDEKEQIRKRISNVGSIAERLATQEVQARDAEPGEEPKDEKKPEDVSPEEQRAYFQYKVDELKSRIQLVEYMLKNDQAEAGQVKQSRKELKEWEQQLSRYKELLQQVPDK